MDLRAYFVAGLAVAALAGIALAAESQREDLLHPRDLDTGFAARDSVSGNLVALTGILVAGSVTAAALLMGRCAWRPRLAAAAVFFASSYLLVLLLQTAMFNYVAEDTSRSAIFAVSPLITNSDATPSTFLGPIALVLLGALGIQAAGRRMMLHMDGRGVEPLLTRAIGAAVVALPFLVVAIVGNVRFLMTLPENNIHSGAYLIMLPLASLGAAAMMALMGIKLWHLGQAVAEPRLGLVAREAWISLRKVEWGVVASIAGLAMLGVLLRPVESGQVEAIAFNLNARTHMQAQIVLVLVLFPWLASHRRAVEGLGQRSESSPAGPRKVQALLGAAGVGAVAAAILAWLLPGALWPWMAMTFGMAIYALVLLPPREALVPGMMAAAVLWAIGNTITGGVNLNLEGQLHYDARPGLLALWRSLAVLLVAWSVARAARGRMDSMPLRLTWPLTAGLGAVIAMIFFLEFPFSAWIVLESGAEYVAIGTVVSGQDTAVRWVLHSMAAVAAFFAGLAIARIERPDWFGHGDPTTTPMPPLPETA